IYRTIAFGEESPVTVSQAINVMRLIEAGSLSNQSKTTIKL
ncbi:oxidoreductase, partial [Proteus mirabilis]